MRPASNYLFVLFASPAGAYFPKGVKPVTVVISKPGGKSVTIQCQHTLTDEQIGWFKAGSALNALT